MSEIQKIAIIAGQLVVGGAERQLFLWLKYMDRSRFSPVVITLHPGFNDYWEKPIEELRIPILGVAQKQLKWMRLIDIFKTLRPFKPDLIHGWHLFASPYAGIAAKAMDCPSLGGFRDSYNIFRKSGRIGKLAIGLTDGILINSKSTAEKIQSVYPKRADRVFSVQNAVLDDYLERSKAREKLSEILQLDPQKTWVGSMGRLDPKKRFDFLLQVISEINDETFQCTLIGDGLEKQKLVNLSSALGIRHKVIFSGEIPNAASYLKALDIFIFTSFDEGLPNVILEAAMAGLPIVTWDLPFYREILENEKTGLLVEAGNVRKLEEAVSRLIASPQLRSQLGREAQAQTQKRFSLEQYICNLTAVYDNLLSTSLQSLAIPR